MKNLIRCTLTLALMISAIAADSSAAETFTTKVSGRGKPIVFIPGLATPGAVWHQAVEHFDERMECHVVTLNGFGAASNTPPPTPLLPIVRDELAAYLRTLGSDRAIVVGHSLGGAVALDLAAHHPDLASKLIIVDTLPFLAGIMQPNATAADAVKMAETTVSAFSSMSEEQYAKMIRQGPNGSTMASSPENIDKIIGWGLASDPAVVSAALRELYSSDLRPSLTSIKVPTLVLGAWIGYAPYSSHDSATSLYRSQYANLAGVEIQITDTARHFIMLDEPVWFHAAVDEFLARPASSP